MADWRPGSRIAAPAIPDSEVVVEAPGDAPRPLPANPVTRILPVVMLVAMAGTMVLFVSSGSAAARNPASLLFPAMTLVSSIGMIAQGRGAATRTADVDEDRKDYLRYLDRLRGEVTENACRQRGSLLWQHPDPRALWTLAGTPRMWERGRTDSDFCYVRIGVGCQCSAAPLTAPDLGPIDQLEPVGAMAVRDFVRAHSVVAEVPIALALNRFAAVAVDGETRCVRDLMRAMLCQLTAFHGPQLLAIVAVVGRAEGREWDWLKWLPHHQHPTLSDAAGPARLQYRGVAEALPALGSAAHTVVVVDGGDMSGAERLAGRHDVTVLEHGPGWRVEASRSLRLEISVGELAVVGDVREVFARPDAMTVFHAELCARRLAPYRPVAEHRGLSTPGDDWPQLTGVGDPGSIQPDIVWRQREPQHRLRAAIGVAPDGSRVELDLKEAAEGGMGPHGLCVGSTGSGKSEFLRTLTLGLIATHPPESLNLVLVDFKGGATFLGLDRARHVSAVITNLSEEAHLVARMKDALAGEMNRRQSMLRVAGGFASVADYERARAAGEALTPLPTLMVIVDEFSELLSQQPDFAEMFVAIGRLGRSLRMHLLLATQRLDEGRLRGLESHLSYRVCLKTFSANESRAVIGIPDAFHLPGTPGAAFLKVGSDEPVAFQTAYVSGPCTIPTPSRRPTAPGVQLFTAAPIGITVELERPGKQAETGRTVLDTVLDRLAGHGTPAHRVWLPPLATSPTLDELLTTDREALAVPIGLVDRPFEQRRDPLVVELDGAAGNVAIVGAPQSGKSTAVRTLITALAASHGPDQVQMYCMDFGGGALAALSALPHVGAVAGRADSDLVRRTIAELTALLRAREAGFRRHGIDSMADYRCRRAAGDPRIEDDPFGDVFLIVDGWASLREDFDMMEPPITALAMRGLSYGVHVVLTASRWAEIRPALKDQIGTRIELRLADAGDSELNRRAARYVPCRPGHGITRDGMHMLIGLPRLDGKHDSAGLPGAIADVAATIRARFGDREARSVRLLPHHVDHATLIDENSEITLGVDEDELSFVTVDLADRQHVLILGDGECGKTAALRLICMEVVRTHSPDLAQLMIVDYRRTLLGVVESDHLAGYAVNEAVLSAALPTLLERLRARIPGPEVDQRQLRTRSWWSGPDLYLIVDDYDLVAAGTANPLAPIVELLPYAKDLGLHMVIARRSGGAGRALFEPLLARLRELGCIGLMMSASPDEGVLLGATRPGPLPPGRARLITRSGERVVQLAWTPPCP